MLGPAFYFSTIRKVTVGIGAMFNNLHLVDGPQDLKVPLSYASREAYWSKLREQDSTGNVLTSTTLPRMSFYMTGLAYDPTRQKNAMNITKSQSTTLNTNYLKQLQSVPYDLAFEVTLYVREVEDGLQLIEQILPTFTPSYNLSLNLLPQMGFTQDVQIVLDDIATEDNYEDGFSTNRIITWTLNLTAKVNIYQPIFDVARINKATANVYTDKSMTNLLEDIGVSVIPSTAKKTDNYTIDTTITPAP